MKDTLKKVLETKTAKAIITAMVIATLFSLAFTFSTLTGVKDGWISYINEPVESAQADLNASSTAEFSVEGIENRERLEKEISIMIEKKRANQQKAEAEAKLQELTREETSLE